MSEILTVKGLRKSYGAVKAVKGISFSMEEGALLAFLGPNGAGKSTSIHIITTFLTADEGSVILDGYELGKEDDQIRNVIGAVFQDGYLDDNLTIQENLMTRGGLYGMGGSTLKQAVERVCRLCELEELLHRPYGKLSGGQRRRCDIARALIHSPKLLFLDEPTTGLDPKTRKLIWNVIKRLQKEEGMSVFLTTHYMEEAKDADDVIVLKQGVIEASGTPSELKRDYAKDHLRLYPNDLNGVKCVLQQDEQYYTIVQDHVDVPLSTTLDALQLLPKLQSYIKDFEVLHGTMDDAFLAIIQEDITV